MNVQVYWLNLVDITIPYGIPGTSTWKSDDVAFVPMLNDKPVIFGIYMYMGHHVVKCWCLAFSIIRLTVHG